MHSLFMLNLYKLMLSLSKEMETGMLYSPCTAFEETFANF